MIVFRSMLQSVFIVARKTIKPNESTIVAKKYHAVKNIVISTVEKVILYLDRLAPVAIMITVCSKKSFLQNRIGSLIWMIRLI